MEAGLVSGLNNSKCIGDSEAIQLLYTLSYPAFITLSSVKHLSDASLPA